MKRNSYSFGLLLIFVGVLFLLLNLKVLNFDWVLFLLSIGLIIGFFNQKHMGYLISGLALLGISLISILNKYIFTNIDVKSFLFLWIFGILSLVLYFRQKNKGFLIIGLILPALGTYNLIEELAYSDANWSLFLLFGISFYIIYIIGYRSSGVEWPKHLAWIMAVVSILFLISSKTMIQFGFWKFISYLIPIILIGLGIKIIYNIIKLKE
ncbi:hypothetical protein [Clostridium sp. Cult2]|uniref:hypothetical protein n=1 Tax=Clostridium sp. Cult2 TaxID=2079003 RepID=UPI001F28D364|nr:hypothetical protein [Clostridium sp. Cult2]MCF6466141.1 hypothetical protein [Clostridium sp. Cult2]